MVGGPVHACKAYSVVPYMRSLRAIRSASPRFDVRVVLADNTNDDGRFARDLAYVDRDAIVLRPEYDRTSPLPIHERIRASQEAIRVAARDLGGAWLSVESDVVPPPDALDRLWTYADEHELEAVQGFFYAGYDKSRFDREKFWLMGLSLLRGRAIGLPMRIELQRPNGYSDAFLGHDLVLHEIPFGFAPVCAEHLDAPGSSRGWVAVRSDVDRTRKYMEWLLGEVIGDTPLERDSWQGSRAS